MNGHTIGFYPQTEKFELYAKLIVLCEISKIQLVVYYQCCVLIG